MENSYERKYLHCNLVALGNAVQSSTDVHGKSQTRNKLSEVVLTERLGFQDLCTALTHVRQLLHQHTGTVTSLQEYQENSRRYRGWKGDFKGGREISRVEGSYRGWKGTIEGGRSVNVTTNLPSPMAAGIVTVTLLLW